MAGAGARLLTSDSLATRLVPAWARHMVLATEHLDGLGLDGFALWRRCVGNNAAMLDRAERLSVRLRTMATTEAVEAFLATFKGGYAQKTNAARTL